MHPRTARSALLTPGVQASGSAVAAPSAAARTKEWRRFRGFVAVLAATALYTLLVLLMARPMLAAFGQAVPVSTQRNLENDALLNLWVVSWVTHALATAPASLFHANIFYPEPNTLAFTDHQLGVVPLFAPLWALFGSPAAGFDAYYLLTFVLTGLSTFALARFWRLSFPAALLAGLIFGYFPPRLSHHYGTQLLAIWWIPLTLLLVERFLRGPTLARGALSALSFSMQWLSAIYLGWHLTVVLAIYLVAALLAEPGAFRRAFWLRALPATALALAIVIPSLWPYKLVSDRWAFEWPLQHLVTHSAVPTSYLNVSPGNLVYGRLLRNVGGPVGVPQELFFGITPLVLAVVGIVGGTRRPRRPTANAGAQDAGEAATQSGAMPRSSPPETSATLQGGSPDSAKPGDRGAGALARGSSPTVGPRGPRWLALTFGAIGLISFVLSFGPYLPTSPPIPLPYLALFEWLPGFHAMRNPVRFVFMVGLALAMLSALGLDEMLARAARPAVCRLIAGIALSVAALEVFTTLPAERLPNFDEEALAYLRATAADGPLVEIPASWELGISHSPRMVASISHWRPIAGGFSGFKPPRDALESVLDTAEPAVVADALQALGIKTVVVHRDELPARERDRVAGPGWREAGFIEQFGSERTLIWSLAPSRVPARAERYEADLQLPRQVQVGGAVSVRMLAQVGDGQIFRDEQGGAHAVLAIWQPAERGASFSQTIRAALPAIVVPKPRVKAEFELAAPPTPGRYRLTVQSDYFSAEREVVVTPSR